MFNEGALWGQLFSDQPNRESDLSLVLLSKFCFGIHQSLICGLKFSSATVFC